MSAAESRRASFHSMKHLSFFGNVFGSENVQTQEASEEELFEFIESLLNRLGNIEEYPFKTVEYYEFAKTWTLPKEGIEKYINQLILLLVTVTDAINVGLTSQKVPPLTKEHILNILALLDTGLHYLFVVVDDNLDGLRMLLAVNLRALMVALVKMKDFAVRKTGNAAVWVKAQNGRFYEIMKDLQTFISENYPEITSQFSALRSIVTHATVGVASYATYYTLQTLQPFVQIAYTMSAPVVFTGIAIAEPVVTIALKRAQPTASYIQDHSPAFVATLGEAALETAHPYIERAVETAKVVLDYASPPVHVLKKGNREGCSTEECETETVTWKSKSGEGRSPASD